MAWTMQRETKLGRPHRAGGREVTGYKTTFEIIEPGVDGEYTVIAKGLREADAAKIVAAQAGEASALSVASLRALVNRLGEALTWAGGYTYAAGRAFRDTDEVAPALAEYEAAKKEGIL